VFNIAVRVALRPQNARTFPFVMWTTHADYRKFSRRSNRILRKLKIVPRRRQFNIAPGVRVGLNSRVPGQMSEMPVANRCRMEILYSGHVQGVGFRYTAKTVATGFEISGVVRNLSDGRVELFAEGSREDLEAFRAAIRDAGLKPFIRGESVTWNAAQNKFRSFEIVH
jgi:acylphosphatase